MGPGGWGEDRAPARDGARPFVAGVAASLFRNRRWKARGVEGSCAFLVVAMLPSWAAVTSPGFWKERCLGSSATARSPSPGSGPLPSSSFSLSLLRKQCTKCKPYSNCYTSTNMEPPRAETCSPATTALGPSIPVFGAHFGRRCCSESRGPHFHAETRGRVGLAPGTHTRTAAYPG